MKVEEKEKRDWFNEFELEVKPIIASVDDYDVNIGSATADRFIKAAKSLFGHKDPDFSGLLNEPDYIYIKDRMDKKGVTANVLEICKKYAALYVHDQNN